MTHSKRIDKNKLFHSLTIFTLTVFLLIKVATVSFSYVPDAEREFKTVVAKPGDTLWSIANEYSDGDIRDKVADIKKFNSLKSDVLCAGDHIKVPLYK